MTLKGYPVCLKNDAKGSWPSVHMWQVGFPRRSYPVADRITQWKQRLIENQSKRRWCHYSIAITLCNQHLLHNDNLKQKSCLLPLTHVVDISQDKWKLLPASGARGKVRRSPKSLQFIFWAPWISVQNFPAVPPVDISVWTKVVTEWPWHPKSCDASVTKSCSHSVHCRPLQLLPTLSLEFSTSYLAADNDSTSRNW